MDEVRGNKYQQPAGDDEAVRGMQTIHLVATQNSRLWPLDFGFIGQ
jgi:hypothetical protein